MPALSEDKDSYNLVLVTTFLIGISTLLPYNAFLSAPDFLQHYDIVAGDGEETLQYENWWNTMPTFSALLGVFPNLIVQVLLLLPCGQRIVIYKILYKYSYHDGLSCHRAAPLLYRRS